MQCTLTKIRYIIRRDIQKQKKQVTSLAGLDRRQKKKELEKNLSESKKQSPT